MRRSRRSCVMARIRETSGQPTGMSGGRAMPWRDVKSRTIKQQRWSESGTRPTAEATGPRAPSRRMRVRPRSSRPSIPLLAGGSVRSLNSPGLYLHVSFAASRTPPYYSYWCAIRKGDSARRSARERGAPISRDHDPIVYCRCRRRCRRHCGGSFQLGCSLLRGKWRGEGDLEERIAYAYIIWWSFNEEYL